MGNISIVHGIIKIEDIEKYNTVISQLRTNDYYPWILPGMFNLSATERPYYYEAPIATFSASYKNLETGPDWSEFILKFEYLLDKLSFEFARVRLETIFMGDFQFFWGSKRESGANLYNDKGLLECEKWYFGTGNRHMYGRLLHENQPEFPHNFNYPVEFNEKVKIAFNKLIPKLNKIEVNTKIFFENHTKDPVLGNAHIHLILTYLRLNDIIDYGVEEGKGLFIIRLKEIKSINSPYDKM